MIHIVAITAIVSGLAIIGLALIAALFRAFDMHEMEGAE